MQTLKDIIETRGNEIIERWAEAAKKAASARSLSRPELTNIMPVYLASLVTPDEPERGRRQLEIVEAHLAARIRHGFDLPELQYEFALLGRCIFREWAAVPSEDRPDIESVDRLLEVVHASTVHISELFVRYLMDDAQSEKRFFRLIRRAFSAELLRPGQILPTLSDRLNAALPVVLDALGAATVATMLYDPETERLVSICVFACSVAWFVPSAGIR